MSHVSNPLSLKFDKKRHRVKHCPCGKSNKDGKFVPYVGYDTKGYCHSCGQVYLPEKNVIASAARQSPKYQQIVSPAKSGFAMTNYSTPRHDNSFFNPPSTLPYNLVTKSLTGYARNNFCIYLNNQFGNIIAGEMIRRYCIGTGKHWPGATVFWQIDATNTVRTGKIMLYNADTGKRVKQPYSHIAWVHSVLKLPAYNLQQCLFGEHLLHHHPGHPVAIVESEKTAVIASALLPQYVWLAAGSVTNLNAAKCRVLKGRNVVLFPDLNAYDIWAAKAKELSSITRFSVSNLLETISDASSKRLGLDVADYLV